MKIFVYIIYSSVIDRYYVGQTEDIERRLEEHRTKKNLGACDWVIKYTETFNNRAEAMNREKEIKKKKRRTYLEWLITNKG